MRIFWRFGYFLALQLAGGALGWWLEGPWGAAAEMYSTFVSGSYRGTVEVDTYLDAYPREELAKFRQRVDGVEFGGAAGWHETEEDADGGGEDE